MTKDIQKLQTLIDGVRRIVVVQADNPDGDSLGSALALEHIFSDMGKDVILCCGVDIPQYLRYMRGWDRVTKELPNNFDLSIIVDTSAMSLLETLKSSAQLGSLKKKPCVILDHHTNEPTIDFASIIINRPVVACGELIYDIAIENKWPISLPAAELLSSAILSDSLGLISESTKSTSIRVVADLVDRGVSLAKLDSARKELQKKSPSILSYKGELLRRVNYNESGNIATIYIPWREIELYSHEYNPAMLVIDEMRMVEKVKVAIVFKHYQDSKVTAKIRCNYGHAVADKLAEEFGGGGHPYAAGFKQLKVVDFDTLKHNVIAKAESLLQS